MDINFLLEYMMVNLEMFTNLNTPHQDMNKKMIWCASRIFSLDQCKMFMSMLIVL